jgi:hypothetical protein
VGGRCRQTCLTIHGFDDLKIGAGQQVSQDLPIIWLILDDQDALAHDSTICFSTRTGSEK